LFGQEIDVRASSRRCRVFFAAELALTCLIACSPGSTPDPGNGNTSTCQTQDLACSETAPCCSGLTCNTAGLCEALPSCLALGDTCAVDRPCCQPLICTDGICAAAGDGTDSNGVSDNALADFSLTDVNPQSARYQQTVSPRDYLGQVSAWYYGHST
jgi:hypothetical protein